MKFPKEVRRFCPVCKKHTIHKVKQEKNRGKNKTHPLTKFSQARLKKRRLWQGQGFGNKGARSRGAMNKWKRYNQKHSKRVDIRYICTECGKSHVPTRRSKRTKKVIFE